MRRFAGILEHWGVFLYIMLGMLDGIISFLRREAVLCIAFLCAAVSFAFVPFDAAQVAASIDARVIVLLFCLMAAVAGLKDCGLFSWCAAKLLARGGSVRIVAFILVMLPFFASMLVTNDVALIAFVPFAIMALGAAGRADLIVRVCVLQAIAANLGGMVTPVGNPQNLFIYTHFHIGLMDFFAALLPFALLTFLMLGAACLALGKSPVSVRIPFDETRIARRRFAFHVALFALCLLCVARVLAHQVLLVVVLVALLAFDRKTFKRVDYGLLGTFVCFFVFSGNIAHIPAVADFLRGLMDIHPLLTSVAASQVISNVPAAVLLAGFTDNWHSLLLGVDLGGLGTPIASLASLIAFRLYMHTPGAQAGAFMKEFACANVAGLAAMLGLYALLFVL